MKRDLTNAKHVKQVNDATKSSNKERISLEKRTFIRILSKEFISEFIHPLNINGRFHPIVCLGGIESGGYAIDVCPICAQAKKHWDKRKKIEDKGKTKKLKAEAKIEYDAGMKLQTRLNTVMNGLKGEAVRERTDEGIKYTPEWEDEAKLLYISKAQWQKLTVKIFEDNSFMKTSEDLLNRDMLFIKKDKQGKKGQDYAEVEITPMKKKTECPSFSNDLYNLEEVFEYVDEKEAKKLLKEFLEGDTDEDEDLEEEEDDIDDDDDEEEEKSKKKVAKKTKKKETKKAVKKTKKKKDEDDEDEDDEDEDDDPEFVKDQKKEDKKASKKSKKDEDEDEDDEDEDDEDETIDTSDIDGDEDEEDDDDDDDDDDDEDEDDDDDEDEDDDEDDDEDF